MTLSKNAVKPVSTRVSKRLQSRNFDGGASDERNPPDERFQIAFKLKHKQEEENNGSEALNDVKARKHLQKCAKKKR